MLAPNTLVQNRYLILRPIGQGGMGAVYEAVDQRLRSPVALKQTLMSGAEMERAFRREAELLANLRHPALPRVMDYFTDGGEQFLVMEYITGEDLSERLARRNAPFPVASVARWAEMILDALDYLHRQQPPIIHRDIKPQNLKLTERDEIILLDFGLAKGAVGGQTQEVAVQSIAGYTPQYAPIEQIQGVGTSPRSDLYALGATVYHLVTGQMPVNAITRAAAAIRQQPDPLAAAHAVNPQIPREFSQWLQQSLMLDSDRRFASAAACRAALRMSVSFDSTSRPSTRSDTNREATRVTQPSGGGETGGARPPITHTAAGASTEAQKATYVSQLVAPAPTAVTVGATPSQQPNTAIATPPGGKQAGGGAGKWLALGGAAIVLLLVAAVALWLLLGDRVNNWLGRTQPPAATTGGATTTAAAYPKALAVGSEARAGEMVYTIVAAQLDRYSQDKLSLRLRLRVYNDGQFSANVLRDSFRLLADDQSLLPTEYPSELLETHSAKEVLVTFAFPAEAKQVELLVGKEGEETNRLPIDLQKTQPLVEKPPSRLSQFASFPVAATTGAETRAGEMRYQLLAAELDRYSTDKLAVKLRLLVTYDGAYSAAVYGDYFRLLADGVPLAPSRAPSESFTAEEAKEVEVLFIIPKTIDTLELQVGQANAETSRLALDFTE